MGVCWDCRMKCLRAGGRDREENVGPRDKGGGVVRLQVWE